jgi:hypothetical protein
MVQPVGKPLPCPLGFGDAADNLFDMRHRLAGEVADRDGRRRGVIEFSLAPIPSGDGIKLPVEFTGPRVSLALQAEQRLNELPKRVAAPLVGVRDLVKIVAGIVLDVRTSISGRGHENCDFH